MGAAFNPLTCPEDPMTRKYLLGLLASAVALTGCQQAKQNVSDANPKAECYAKETLDAARSIISRQAARDTQSDDAKKWIASNPQYLDFGSIVVDAINKDVGKVDCEASFSFKFDNDDQRQNFANAIKDNSNVPDALGESGGYVDIDYEAHDLADGSDRITSLKPEPIAAAFAAFAEMKTKKPVASTLAVPSDPPAKAAPQVPPGFFQ